MFNFDDFLKLAPKKLYREEVFSSAPKAPVIIEWWNPHPVYRMHKHAGFEEFAIIRQGLSVHYHRNSFQLLTPGDAIFVGTEHPHAYVCTHNLGLFNVVFNAEYFYSYFPEVENILSKLKTLSKNKNSLRISSENLLQTLSIVYRIEYEHSLHFDDYTSSSMFSLFLQITIMLLRDNTEGYQVHKKNLKDSIKQLENLSNVITFTRKHIDLPISEISAELTKAGLNNKTIQRYFLKHLHITLYQYIQLQKLILVMNAILKNPASQLSDILIEAGYTNYRNFSRHIHKFFGISPKEFQKNILNIQQLSQVTSHLE
ncbi:MAG: AraC family transcriptional regulator [Niabella sp.]